MIHVLVVDDSEVARRLVTDVIDHDAEMVVIGAAKNGVEAVEMAVKLKPDLITMDIGMPKMDGVTATRRIMARQPTPIVVVSALPSARRSAVVFDSIAAGAVDVLAKPRMEDLLGTGDVRERFLSTLKAMAGVAVVRRRPRSEKTRATRDAPAVRLPATASAKASDTRSPVGRIRVIAIGASSGGPPVVASILEGLGVNSPPVVLVQHIVAGFTSTYAGWLDDRVAARVAVARHGDTMRPGHVYVAPDHHHLEVTRDGRTRCHKALPVNHHRPSISVLFQSVARHVGRQGIGVQLTGMGSDGADGLLEIRRRGGMTLVQSEESSMIASMPRAAVDSGAARRVASPEGIRSYLAGLRLGPLGNES